MVWRVVTRHASLAGNSPTAPPAIAYALLDGLFENCLVRHHAGDTGAGDRLRTGSAWLLDRLSA